MNEMVERVAKALAEQDPEFDPDWDYTDAARAVIQAMREATGPMAQEGAEALNPYADEVQAFTDNVEIALDVWQAMVDTALK